MTALLDVRQSINEIDQQIVKLLETRADLALQAAKIKKAQGEQGKIYDGKREREVLSRLALMNQGALSDDMIQGIFAAVISACRNLQIQHYELRPGKVTLSIMGRKGSYSEAAGQQFLLQNCLQNYTLAYDVSSQQVIERVMKNQAEYGVMGISNSTAGLVQETLLALAGKACKVVGVVTLPIEHKLMILPGQQDITAIYSHEQALTQCQQYLQHHYPQAKQIPYDDTAIAAEHLRQGKIPANSAVIASGVCASLYNLQIIADNIIDKADNATTFLVIGHTDNIISGEK